MVGIPPGSYVFVGSLVNQVCRSKLHDEEAIELHEQEAGVSRQNLNDEIPISLGFFLILDRSFSPHGIYTNGQSN